MIVKTLPMQDAPVLVRRGVLMVSTHEPPQGYPATAGGQVLHLYLLPNPPPPPSPSNSWLC